MRVIEATDFYYPWIGGPAPVVRNLSLGLLERGHDVLVVCPSPTGRPYREPGSPSLHRVRTWPVPFGHNLRAGLPVFDLNRLLRSWRPDVVHIHHPFPISVAALLAAKTRGIPVVATNHTIPDCTLFGLRDSLLMKPARAALSLEIRAVLSSALATATPTETAARLLREMGFSKPVTVISNGIDTDRFHPVTATDASVPPVVLYTGRLDDDKDMQTFVDAIPIVLSKTRATFRIGGEGTDRPRLERLVADMGLSHAVQFTGYVSEEELPHVYQGAALYGITSRVELQSISTLEALASGLPVVAVNACALPELVRNDYNGFLVPPGESRAFGEAIVRILSNRPLATHFGRNSRTIAEGHSIKAMISTYESLLQSVVIRQYAPEGAYGTAGG